MAAPENQKKEDVKFDWSSAEYRLAEEKYNVIDTPYCPEWSQGLATSLNYFAYCTSETEIGILPSDIREGSDEVSQGGRAAGYGAMALTTKKPIYKISTDTPVTDFVFDPFSPSTLYSSHAGGVLKGWTLPEDALTENITENSWQLEGLCGNAIHRLTTSDVVSNLLIASGTGKVSVINTEAQEVVKTWSSPVSDEKLLDSGWDLTASTFKTCSAGKSVYSVDPRAATLSKTIDIRFQPSRVIHLTEDGAYLVLGTDSFGRSLYQVFDARSDRPLVNQRIPKFSGTQIAEYDSLTKLLFLGCRLQTGVTLYNAVAPLSGAKEMTVLAQENLSNVNVGWALSPKIKLKNREIHKLNVMTEQSIIPLATVARAKMYTKHREPEPSFSFNDWVSGECKVRKETVDLVLNATVVRKVAKSKFVNVNVVETEDLNHKDMFEKCNVNRKSTHAGYNIRANQEYIIYNGKGQGLGALCIAKVDDIGNRQDYKKKIRCHTGGMTSFDISPFVSNEIVTGGQDGRACIWHFPPEGFKKDATEPDHTIECFEKVQFVRFHPFIPQLLLIADSWSDGSQAFNRIRLINMNTWETTNEIDVDTESYVTHWDDVEFDLRGRRIAATTSEKKIIIMNLRSESIDAEFSPEESFRKVQVRWLDEHRVLTIGFKQEQMQSKRGFSVWNVESEEKELTIQIDTDNAIPIVHVDQYHSLVYFSGQGQRRIRVFEVLPSEIFPHRGSHLCWDDVLGWSFFPKQFTDVSKIEINKMWKLSKTRIIPVSFQLMRKRKEYFQDDVYVPILKAIPPMLDLDTWISGTDVPDERTSLQPDNMMALSIAPAEDLTERQRKRVFSVNNNKKSKLENKETKETAKELLDKISRIDQDKFAPDIGQWTVEAIGTEVDSDEWSS